MNTTIRHLTHHEWDCYHTHRLPHIHSGSGDLPGQSVTDDDDRRPGPSTRVCRLLAERSGVPLGLSSAAAREQTDIAEVLALRAYPGDHQADTAWLLLTAAATWAAAQKRAHLHYWVSTEDPPALAFAINFGFRISPHRRDAVAQQGKRSHAQIALELPLTLDPGTVPNPALPAFDRASASHRTTR